MHDTLKAYAIEHLGVPADADDKQFEAAVVEAHAKGDLTWDQIQKMGRGEAVEEAPEPDADLEAAASLIGKAVGQAMGPINQTLSKLSDRIEKMETAAETKPAPSEDETPGEPTAADKMFAEAAGSTPLPRMKSPIEVGGYSTTKQMARYPERLTSGGQDRRHPMAGQPVMYGAKGADVAQNHCRPMYDISDAEAAMVGAWAKWNILGGGRLTDRPELSEHERQLVNYCLDKAEWVCGEPTTLVPCWKGSQRLANLPGNVKASLLGDTTSGGSYAVPRAFDDQLFMDPILNGELVPHVSIMDLPAGVSVDGVYLAGAITVTSNTAEGSNITLFDCTGLIGNLDTTIFTCAVGIQLGMDWLSDTPVNFGRILPQQMGERLREWLDNQIANGDGTTEPEGIFTKSGVNSTSSVNGTAGAITVNDIEELIFGLTKARRQASGRNCRFVTSDLMYKRMCQVPVGSSDARRVLKPGMDHENYTLMDRAVSIEEHISNGSAAFCALNEYQLIRRLGSQFRETSEGYTLFRLNEKMLLLRARFGGQLSLPGACMKITDLDQSIEA